MTMSQPARHRSPTPSGVCLCPMCSEDRLVPLEQDGRLFFQCSGCATRWGYGMGRLWMVSS